MIPKAPGVYLIKNQNSGRVYVGATRRLDRRWSKHRKLLTDGAHRNRELQADWNTHGPQRFRFVPLLRCNVDDLDFYERRALEVLRVTRSVYNVPGDYRSNFQKLSDAAKRSRGYTGKRHSNETRKRMSEAQKERFLRETADGVRRPGSPGKRSAEARAKMSEAQKRRWARRRRNQA